MKNILMCGNEAIAEAAIQAGCRFYAGYPITPQNELTAYMANRMDQIKGVFIQSESELAAINMVFGASVAGGRAMTSSSSPGISLKQEGISYLAACQLPAVIVNVMRGGPGLGNIAPAQSDYFQATKSGGHGDYHQIVLAPHTVSEAFDLTYSAFDLADKYRTPVMVLTDGLLGQMMEPLITDYTDKKKQITQISAKGGSASGGKKPWALTGCKNRAPRIIRSLLLDEGALEKLNNALQEKYNIIKKKEVRYEGVGLEKAKFILVAYGSVARIAKQVVDEAKERGLSVGLLRPITLWPFPTEIINKMSKGAKAILVVEMSCGQMLEDVKLAVWGNCPVYFYGRPGGGVPSSSAILNIIKEKLRGEKNI